MATTLRGFQSEIDQIHERELARQRAEGRIALEKEKHKEKAPQNNKGKDTATDTTEDTSAGQLNIDADDSQEALQVR